MLNTRIACPTCGKRLKTTEPIALGDRFRCPGCQQSFNVQEKDYLPAPAQPEVFTAPAPRTPPPYSIPDTLPIMGDPTPRPGVIPALPPASFPVSTPLPSRAP